MIKVCRSLSSLRNVAASVSFKGVNLDNARPSAELIARVNAEHLSKTPLKPADLLFVFGTRHGVDKCIDLSYELWWRTGYCTWLLVSGGITPGSQ
jgi:hypothetical protein